MLKFLKFCLITTRLRSVVLSVAIATSILFVFAQSKMAQPAAPLSYENEALVVEQSDTSFTHQKDGTGEKSLSMRMKITSEAGARQCSIISIPYAAANETPKIEMILVHHPDGTSIETPATDAMDMPAPSTLRRVD